MDTENARSIRSNPNADVDVNRLPLERTGGVLDADEDVVGVMVEDVGRLGLTYPNGSMGAEKKPPPQPGAGAVGIMGIPSWDE